MALVMATTSTAAAAADERYTRTVSYIYDAPAVATSDPYAYAFCFSDYENPPRIGCAPLEPHGAERFISVDVDESSGIDVAIEVRQFSETTGMQRRERFCTTTEQPVKIMPKLTYGLVSVLNGPCPDGSAGLATSGTINITYSRQP